MKNLKANVKQKFPHDMTGPIKHSRHVKCSSAIVNVTPGTIHLTDGSTTVIVEQKTAKGMLVVEDQTKDKIGCRKLGKKNKATFGKREKPYSRKKIITSTNIGGATRWGQLTELYQNTKFDSVKALIDLINIRNQGVPSSMRNVVHRQQKPPIDQTTYNTQIHKLISNINPALKPSQKSHNQQERQELIIVLAEVMSSGEIAAQSFLKALSVLRPSTREKFLKAFLNNDATGEDTHLILSFEKTENRSNVETTIGKYSWYLQNSVNNRKELLKFSTRRAFVLYTLYAFDKKYSKSTNSFDITKSKQDLNALYKLVYYADKTGQEDKSKEDSDIDNELFKSIANWDNDTEPNQDKRSHETNKKNLINCYNHMKKAVIETCKRMDEVCEILIIKNYKRHLMISRNKIRIDRDFLTAMNKFKESKIN